MTPQEIEMTNFEYAFAKTIGLEGGYTVDTGGRTKYGISQNSYPALDIPNLTLQQAHAIYKRDYWDKARLDNIENKYIASKIFDLVVNIGLGGMTIVQHACNYLQSPDIDVDGDNGPQTSGILNRLARKNTFALYMAINLFQGMFYANIADKHPEIYEKYAAGWMKRLVLPKELMP